MAIFLNLLQGGWDALLAYLSVHVLTYLVPAFFTAGAIAVFISPASVIKYFGPGTKKMLTYMGLVVVFATITGYIFGLIAN